MPLHPLTAREWLKALAVGVANGVLLSAVMVPLNLGGVSPFPKPVGLAFAETVLGGPLPLPVGLVFHLVWVSFWSVAFVAVSRDSLTLGRALILAALLWVGALVMFFPMIGWGFLGLGVGPQLIVAAAVPHLLFGVFLWALCRVAFRAA